VSGPYPYVTPLERLLPEFEATVVSRDFAADVTWQIQAPEEQIERLAAALVELSRGELEIVL
jgi:putative IMPACT (imprinted ancient) family translation regulator